MRVVPVDGAAKIGAGGAGAVGEVGVPHKTAAGEHGGACKRRAGEGDTVIVCRRGEVGTFREAASREVRAAPVEAPGGKHLSVVGAVCRVHIRLVEAVRKVGFPAVGAHMVGDRAVVCAAAEVCPRVVGAAPVVGCCTVVGVGKNRAPLIHGTGKIYNIVVGRFCKRRRTTVGRV